MEQVGDGHHFAGRVHVAVRHRHQPRGHAAPGQVNGVGVGAGAQGRGLDRVGDLLGLGRLGQHFEDLGVRGRTSGQHRTSAQRVFADFGLLHAGNVGRVGDVHHQRHVGRQSEGAGARAAARVADLFLGRRDRHGPQGATGRVPGQQPKGFQHDERPHAVVDRPACDPVARQPHHARVQHRRVAHAHPHLRQLFAGRRAHVDPELGHLGRLLALLRLHEMDRLAAHHAGNVAVLGQDAHALAHEHLGVPAADGAEVEQSFLRGVGDLEADLVDVAGQQGQRTLVFLPRGVAVAHDVGARGGEVGGFAAPLAGGSGLEARRTGGVQQALQERQVGTRGRTRHRLPPGPGGWVPSSWRGPSRGCPSSWERPSSRG